MQRVLRTVLALALLAVLSGCTHKEDTSSSATSSTSSSAATEAASPASEVSTATLPPPGKKTPVTFQFKEVAVSTQSAPVLRIGITIMNGSSDPLLCDPSEFSVRLSDGSMVAADTSADSICTPTTVDAKGTGDATMFFDLKAPYSGIVTLLMTVDNAVVGLGQTQVH